MSNTCNIGDRFVSPDPATAAEEWRQQVVANPEDGSAHFRLASWLHTWKQNEEAIHEYQTALALLERSRPDLTEQPRHFYMETVHYWLGKALQEVDRTSEARVQWELIVNAYAEVSEELKNTSSNYHRAQTELNKLAV